MATIGRTKMVSGSGLSVLGYRLALFCLALAVLPQGANAQTSGEHKQFTHRAAGIDFHVETRGSGPHVVLIPSGQGDCGAYKLLAEQLEDAYTVITFDMPGFSRSSAPNWDELSSAEMANQVAALVRSLGVESATFYGSSSGGATVMSLVADHPELVRVAVSHEPALMANTLNTPFTPPFQETFFQYYEQAALKHGSYYAASKARTEGGASLLSTENTPWADLGEDYAERKHRNHETWAKYYLKGGEYSCCNRIFTAEEMSRAPIVLTIGLESVAWATGMWGIFVGQTGVEAIWMPGKHFPYVTYPDLVAKIIDTETQKHLD